MIMKQTTGDFALLFRKCTNSLISLSGTFIYNLLRAILKRCLSDLANSLYEQFELTKMDAKIVLYTGICFDDSRKKPRKLNQSKYIM